MRLTLVCLLLCLVVKDSTTNPFNGYQPALPERAMMFGGHRPNCNKHPATTTTPRAIVEETTTSIVEKKTTKRKDNKEPVPPNNVFFPIYFNGGFPPTKQEKPSTVGSSPKPRRPAISIANSFSSSGAATSHSVSLN